MSTPVSTEAEAVGLRRWARGHDPHVQAAVGLLIGHETWLRHNDFRSGRIERDADGTCWIDWTDARAAFDAGRFAKASSTELAVLDLVIALGADRYRFSRMDDAQARLITESVAAALGGAR